MNNRKNGPKMLANMSSEHGKAMNNQVLFLYLLLETNTNQIIHNMKNVIKAVAVLLFAVLPVVAFAQEKKKLFRQTIEIATIENDGESTKMVFSMPENGQNHYYLCVGTLGFGNNIVQLDIDPFSELFIPLGDTLAEVQDVLEKLKSLVKSPKGSAIELQGSLAIGYPTEELVPVTITSRRFIFEKRLQFAVPNGTNIRATYLPKSDIGSLLASVKIYRKLHPGEL